MGLTNLEILELIHSNFKQLQQWGYNNLDAGERCVRDVKNAPHIYKDEYKSPAYCMKGSYVLVFGDGIYKKI